MLSRGVLCPSLQSISACDTSFIPVVCAWMSSERIVIRIILQTCHWHLHCFKTIAAYDLPLNLCAMVIISGSKGKFGVMGAWWGRCLLWVHQRHRSWLALRVPSTTGTEYWGSDWPLYLWWNESVVGSSWKERCGHVDGFYVNASSKDAKVKICWLEIWLFSCKCKMLNAKIRILEYEIWKF